MRIPELIEHTIDYRLVGLSALEAFFHRPQPPITTIETTAGVVELAAAVESLQFPGLPEWDASFPTTDREILVRSVDRLNGASTESMHPLMAFSYDPVRRAFADPHDLYPLLRTARNTLADQRKQKHADPEEMLPESVSGLDAVEAALLASRFPLVPTGYPGEVPTWTPRPSLPPLWHRLVLEQVIAGPLAWRGLDILYRSGYVHDALPELVPMNRTEHSKEGHPEGNVWRHTLETLRYRKKPDAVVGLALLLHDAGKPYAEPEGNRMFNGHAEIGAKMARRLLERLAFDQEVREDVSWLVRYHMMPGALEQLPDHRRDPIMASPLFPRLLELYRCDVSSTYRGPEGYYRACKVYRRFLKRNRRAGEERAARRLVELYVE